MLADSPRTYVRQAGQAGHRTPNTKEMEFMTTHVAHPSLQVTPKTAGLGLAGLLVAAATGFTVVSAFDDAAVPVAPGSNVTQVEPPSGARDSWEGRIGPGADSGGDVGGIRDSWMPAGATDQELGEPKPRR